MQPEHKSLSHHFTETRQAITEAQNALTFSRVRLSRQYIAMAEHYRKQAELYAQTDFGNDFELSQCAVKYSQEQATKYRHLARDT